MDGNQRVAVGRGSAVLFYISHDLLIWQVDHKAFSFTRSPLLNMLIMSRTTETKTQRFDFIYKKKQLHMTTVKNISTLTK